MSTTGQSSVFTERPNFPFPIENKVTFLPQMQKQIPIKVILSDETEQSSTSEEKEKNSNLSNILEINLKDKDKIIYPFFN